MKLSSFTGYGRTNEIDFGDYVEIEQFRYGVPNEMFIHKVVGALESNTWVDVPVRWDKEETIHNKMEKVLNVICCGIDETKVYRVREKDCIKIEA
jgi:hypothetical protein